MSAVIMPASIAFALGFKSNSFATHLTSIFWHSTFLDAQTWSQPKAASAQGQTTFATVLAFQGRQLTYCPEVNVSLLMLSSRVQRTEIRIGCRTKTASLRHSLRSCGLRCPCRQSMHQPEAIGKLRPGDEFVRLVRFARMSGAAYDGGHSGLLK